MDELLENLIELNLNFERKGIPLILGGGMGLFVKALAGKEGPRQRYPFLTEARATADLDIFLSAETIVSSESIGKVKEILKALSYEVLPEAKYFQFQKQVSIGGSSKNIRIDFLSAPPEPKDISKVKVSSPRIKPKGIEGFHAFKVDEAEGLDIGLDTVELKGHEIKVLSSYNYLIMKLHAFNDRKDDSRETSDQGRHHAFDIFTTVTRMNEGDWKNALLHKELHQEKGYLKNSAQIQNSFFGDKDYIGFIRLRESTSYVRHREEYDSALDYVVEDLTELFKLK